MKGFENLLSGEKKYLFFDGLSSLECQKIIFEAKKRGCVVERVGCWTSHDDYFCIHDYERFTVDYLVDIEEWETQAFNQLIQTYEKTILQKDSSNLPKFEVQIARKYDPELLHATRLGLEKLRNDPDYTPKDFFKHVPPSEIIIE